VAGQRAGRLESDVAGAGNTGLGYYSLNSLSSGSNNVGIGVKALQANTSAGNNTAVGRSALFASSSGFGSNTAIGSQALYQNTTGYRNTALGYLAGSTSSGPDVVGVGISTGDNNTFIGSIAGPLSSATLTNAAAIGANAKVSASNTMIFGDGGVVGWGFGAQPASCCDAILVGTNTNNGNGATLSKAGDWFSTSDSTKKYNAKPIRYGLREIMQLRPVDYQWKGSGQKDFGFLAQEIKNVLPEIVHGEEGHMTLSYGHITAVLTKAMQEQQKEIETLKAQLKEKDEKVSSLESSVTAMSGELENIKRILGVEAKANSIKKKDK
jgi:hypothetical protein